MKKSIMRILMVLGLLGFAAMNTACSSSVVPPGTTVIVVEADGSGDVKTDGSYWAWGRDRVYFIDNKLKSFTEQMQILCADDINMTVDVKWLGSFDATQANVKVIKQKVPAIKVSTGDMEGYQLSLDAFYKTAMKDIVRSNARTIVSPYITDNIREQRGTIEAEIRKRVIEKFQSLGYPVKTTDVLVSNLDYPKEVTDMRKAIKNAQLKDLENAAIAQAALTQAGRDDELAAEKGKAKVTRALAEAAANRKLSKSLTPAILQMEQIEMMKMIAQNSNKDMIIMPYDAMSGQGINQALLKKAGNRR